MGVLGLTPFLQKTCPQVVRQLPHRLRSLAGKKIVIDGTLITQRFHFAPMPQRYRHVLAWYRLARHLKENNIEVICVFDGKQRSLAKEAEIGRRRRDRMMTAARGEFEFERLSRLRRLTHSLYAWRSFGIEGSERDLGAFRKQMENWKPLTSLGVLGLPFIGAAYLLERIGAHAISKLYPRGPSPPISYSSSGDLEVPESLKVFPVPDSTAQTPGSPLADISQLHAEYCQSIPQLASLSEPITSSLASPDVPSATTPEEDMEAFNAEYALSKSQQGLTMEEDQLWIQLVESAKSGTVTDSVAGLAQSLEVKSGILSESYKRRTDPPTSRTYQESREILRAMGIPCIEPSGPFEAEALAAALVINGRADYVASEDTDVLIYDAPLIRNLASQQNPLILISGPEVRAALDLDRTSFIDFALLLGTDFSQRIKNVGPARALKFIREHGCIERVIEHEKYSPRIPPEQYLAQVGMARLVFQTLPPVPDDANFQQQEANDEEVSVVLDKYGLSRYDLEMADWDALSGNYFADDPSAA